MFAGIGSRILAALAALAFAIAPAAAQKINLATQVQGILALANGGTAANLTASTGGIVYSGASALAILSGTATANQILMSGSSAAPTWSTATFPATATSAGTILRSDGTNWAVSQSTYPDLVAGNNVLYATAANTVGSSTALTFNGSTLAVTGDVTITDTATDPALAIKAASGGDQIYFQPQAAGSGLIIDTRNSADTDFEPLRFRAESIQLDYRTGVNTSAAGITLNSGGNTTLAGTLTVQGTTFTGGASPATATGSVVTAWGAASNSTWARLQKNTQDVTTSAVTILTAAFAGTGSGLAIVQGRKTDGTARFQDLVWYSDSGDTTSTINQHTISGAPDTRTYTVSSSNLQLQMGGNTYDINVIAFEGQTPE